MWSIFESVTDFFQSFLNSPLQNFHQDRRSKSVEATITIKERSGKIKTAILETKYIIDDFRTQSLGGLLAAFLTWGSAISQSLLTNSEVWVEMGK